MRRTQAPKASRISRLVRQRPSKLCSYRSLFYLILFAAFLFPFAFIIGATSKLDLLDKCANGVCRDKANSRVSTEAVAQGQVETTVIRSPSALLAALKAGSDVRSAHDDLPETVTQLAAMAKEMHFDTATLISKLKLMVELQEERARVAKLQRALYRHFASKAIPKGLHCLELRLTAEHAVNPLASRPLPAPALVPHLFNNSLLHLVLITDNVFAASVIVASAVRNSANADELVFHIVTDGMSFPAMHAWFSLYPPKAAVVEVLSIDELESMTNGTMPVQEVLQGSEALKKHYFGDNTDLSPNSFDSPAILAAKLAARNPKYISIMNHLRMYLPMVFPKLKRVIFLDDDVVIQKDLQGLWDTDLKGKVLGAVLTCQGADQWVMRKRFRSYFNFSDPLIAQTLDPDQCAWAYGMNLMDLDRWRETNITQIYHKWQRLNLQHNLTLWRLGTLPPALIAFEGQLQPLNASWHMLGLGYQPDSDPEDIKNAAVIHFNGPAKPWLEMAIIAFRPFWSKYVDYDNDIVKQCNIFDY